MNVRKTVKDLLIFLLSILLTIRIWRAASQLSQTSEIKPANNKSEILEAMESWQKALCANQREQFLLDDRLQSLPLMHREVTPTVHLKNIFIVESACNPQPLYRTWCSVESWAGQHPDKDLWYILISPFISDTTGIMKSLLDQYPNIRVVSSKFRETFRKTPLWDLFNSDKWLQNTAWPESNLSNMVRGALVWKWGGVYTDSDTICIRSTTKFTNAVGLYKDNGVNGAVLIGQPRHQAFWMLMEYLKENFKGNVWGHNGPEAITRVMKKLCKGASFSKIASNEEGCQNMSLLTARHFYPVPFQQHKTFMLEREETDLEKLFKDSYVLHFWNKLTKKDPITVGSKSILETAAKKFCPVTYRVATMHSHFF
ncbi:lactosylceramide 4-alpha-galactosyltransferase-like [Macrobrachium rosenbergii]|uniref:lactosylceramide 4-alpha-galactosyltransferase-like n=1 Tax=Macrobrachium rosenbergii TaxID=79674 RepID=UPI0034D79ADE